MVETDASEVAVGAVLAQEREDGKIHPVDHASINMNDAEFWFYECEREALAVVFSLKKFILYQLSSKPFQIIRDQQ